MMVPNFLYTNSMFITNSSLAHFTRNNLWSKQSGTFHVAYWLFSIFRKVTSMTKIKLCFEMLKNSWLGSFAAQLEISGQ